MDFNAMLNSFWQTLVERLPHVLMALGILIVGWIIAVVVRAIVRKGLGLIKLDELVVKNTESKMNLENGIALGAYYVVLVLALIMFFDALNLNTVSGTLQGLVDEFFGFLPNLIGAAALAVVGWVLATIVRRVVSAGLGKTTIDEKLQTSAGMKPMSKSIGDILYGLVLLMFLPMVLSTLRLNGLLDPVRNMIDDMLASLPNILAAGLLGLFGWYLANLLRNLVVNLLQTTGVDKLGARAGLKGTMPLSRLIGLLVFIFVFVPTMIAALNELGIDAIAVPATAMLQEMMDAIPNIFSAAVILAVAWLVSGFVADVITKLLGGLGFDNVPAKLGLRALPQGTSPSKFVGKVIVFFVMLFAVVEAANALGFSQVSDLVALMIAFGGQVLLGIAIISVGLWIANLAHAALSRQAGANATFFAGLARVAILGIVFAMGLGAMDVAPRIVEAAFILTLGAVAVAFALSFGLGGREAAGKQMEHWLSKLRRQG